MSPFRAWAMWSVAVFFFAYQFIMRLFPGLVMNNLLVKHQLDATAFGVLSSFYYIGYAGMQIPVAALLDRFGPRKIISLCILTCSVSTLLFIHAEQRYLLYLARFLIGVGSAAGFLGVSKVTMLAFPEHKYSKMVGLSFTFGLMGAIYGGKPVSFLIERLGWQNVGSVVGSVGIAAALMSWMLLGKHAEATVTAKSTSLLDSLRRIVRDRRLLLLAVGNLLMVGALEGFADVWGVSFLTKALALTQSDAALAVSFIFVGMLFGGPILASLASRFSAYHAVTAFSGIVTAAFFGFLLTRTQMTNYALVCSVLFVVGILCCYQVLVFSIGSQLVSAQDKGITVAFLNCINMFGGSFFHLLIGSLLDLSWQGLLVDGVRFYAGQEYVWALMSIPLCALVGAWLIYISRGERRLPV